MYNMKQRLKTLLAGLGQARRRRHSCLASDSSGRAAVHDLRRLGGLDLLPARRRLKQKHEARMGTHVKLRL